MRFTRYLCLSAILLGAIAHSSAGATLTVCASGCAYSDPQAAIDAAQPGDTILLRAGETFIGHYALRAKASTSTAAIVIRSDAPASALPGDGVRLVPPGIAGANVQTGALPRLRGRGGQWKTTPVLTADPGAHHYTLQFLDIDGIAQEGWSTLVELGTMGANQDTLAEVPHDIVIDRLYIHGHPTKGQKRCLALNGRNVDILNSRISGCASFVSDAQAIAGFNGPGPFKIINNYLEATGENVMFGGADPTISNLVPTGIEIRRNHLVKPLSWRGAILAPPSAAPTATAVAGGGSLAAGTHYFTVVALMDSQSETAVSAQSAERAVTVSGSSGVKLSWPAVTGADRYRVYRGSQAKGENRYLETSGATTTFTYTGTSEIAATPPSSGTVWTIKNLLELKNAQQVTVDGNMIEQVWASAQKGFAILLTPKNQDGAATWTAVRDITISNNIIRHASGAIVIQGIDYVHTSQRTTRVTIRNNLAYDIKWTWGNSPHFLLLTGGPTNVTVDHNTSFHDDKVVLIDDGPSSGFVFTNNVAPHNTYGIFGSGAGFGANAIKVYFPDGIVRRNALGGGSASLYPPDNFFPDMPTFLSQFVNAGANDYRLTSTSTFRGAGTDGKDLGVDFTALNAAQGGTSAPPPTGGTLAPYGGTAAALPGTIQAENFDEGGAEVAYHDATAGNAGGKYRTSDVDVESTTDAGGGFNVGWMSVGEWLKYSVNVAAGGTYDLEFRVASNGGGGTIHLEVNGSNKTGSIGIPNTGGWQSWTTVRKSGVSLSAGPQVWRLVVDQAGASGATLNLNRIVVTAATTSTPTAGGGDIVLYASDASRIAGNWARVSSTGAAGGQLLQSVDRGWSTPNVPKSAPTDYFEMSFTPEANRDYRLWIRLRAQGDSKYNESVWVQFSGAVTSAGAPKWPLGSTAALLVNLEACSGCGVSGWGWQNRAYWLSDNGVVRFGSSALQTIRVQTREDGAQIDQVVLSPVTYFDKAPGTLKNDTTIVSKTAVAPTPITLSSDIVLYASDVARLSGNWARRSSATAAGGEMLASADKGWSSPDAPLVSPSDYVEMTFTPEANRPYRIWLRLSATADSKWNDSVWVQFSGAVNASGAAVWRIGSTSALLVNLEACSSCGMSGWGWQDGAWWVSQSAVVQFPTTGTQTIRIQTREDGVQVDQIVLSSETYLTNAPGTPTRDATIVPR